MTDKGNAGESLSFGQWVKRRRKALDLTQQALAQQAACSLSTLKKIESGTLIPSRQLAELMVKALGVPERGRVDFVLFARGLRPCPDDTSLWQREWTPATPSANARRFTLPAPLTSMIGREQEIAAGIARMRATGVRLMTLIGPPGAGKTRLAIAIAAGLEQAYADGACLIALETVDEAAHVPAAIAQGLGISDHSAPSITEALRQRVRDKHVLLVLDNFGHVLPAAPIAQMLLEAAPHMKIIATSREPLRLYGEHELVVPPLELPSFNPLPPIEALRHNPAIALFVDRARAGRPDFDLTADNAYTIAAICAWLDGLPLAIEMAAARLKWHSPEIVLAQISQHLALSAPSLRPGAGPRTLRRAIDWSYALLTADEQRALARVSVFADHFTAESAAAVCADARLDCSTIDLLMTLSEKSVLQRSVNRDGQIRFKLLNVIRGYGREKLAESGEAEAVCRRWAAHYLTLAGEAQPHLLGPAQQQWFNRLDEELSNLRAVIDWCAGHDRATGIAIVVKLQWHLYVRGHLSEARAWLDTLLKAGSESAVALTLVASAQCAAGFLAWQQGDHATAVSLSCQALQSFERAGDQAGMAYAHYNLGNVALLQSDYAQAEAHLTESLALLRKTGDTHQMALVLNALGLTAKDRGQFKRAQAYHEESLRLHQRIGNMRGMAQSWLCLGIVAYWQGNFAEAVRLSQEGVALNRHLGNSSGLAYCLDTLGAALHKEGQTTQSRTCLTESLHLFNTLGDQVGQALVHATLGMTDLERDWQAASAHFQTALELSMEIGDKRRSAFALEGLAITLSVNQPTLSARLLGAAQTLRESIHSPVPVTEQAAHQRAIATLTATLGPAGYAAEFEQGRQWSPPQARAAIALGTLEP